MWLVGLVFVHYVELISKTVTFALIIVEMEPSCVNVCHSLCGVSVSVPEQQQQQICNKTAGRGVRPRTSCTWWDPLIEKVTSFLAKFLHSLKSQVTTSLWHSAAKNQDKTFCFPNEYEYIRTQFGCLLASKLKNKWELEPNNQNSSYQHKTKPKTIT